MVLQPQVSISLPSPPPSSTWFLAADTLSRRPALEQWSRVAICHSPVKDKKLNKLHFLDNV